MRKTLKTIYELFLVCVIAYSAYMVATLSYQVYRGSELYYKHLLSSVSKGREGIEALQEINPDIIGWLQIQDSRVDFPVLLDRGMHEAFAAQDLERYIRALDPAISSDPQRLHYKYLYLDYQGRESATGSVTMDYRNTFEDPYIIIYGHNAENPGVMFSDLTMFLDEDYWESHPGAAYYDGDGRHTLALQLTSVVSGYDADVFGISGIAHGGFDLDAALKALEEGVVYGKPAPFDKYLLLSTCYTRPEDPRRIILLYGVVD